MASFVAFEDAQQKLAELIDRAKSGEEIVIQQHGQAVAKIVSVPADASVAGTRTFGQNFLGVSSLNPHWDALMSEQELKEWNPGRRTLAECIAMLPEDSTATIDEDFDSDINAAIEVHREPADTSAWD